jgi:hypothetical protein
MVPLLTVGGAFQAKVVAARLGSEGIVTWLRGGVDGPYPFGDVEVLVDVDDVELARQLLLADQVEAVYDGRAATAPRRPGRSRVGALARHPWAAVLAIVVMTVLSSLVRILSL